MVLTQAGFVLWSLALLTFAGINSVAAFSNDRSDNLAVYWGQDSAGQQQRLSFYCQDDTIDVIPIAFLYIFFGKGGLPVIDLSNTCSKDQGSFPGTDLAECSFLASDIKQCQAKGKLVTLSLGGANSQVGFSSDSQASSFAVTIWNLFLGGSSNTRPFGDAILDGIDLDIESGSSAFYGTFVNKLRSLTNGASKRYYVTAAPQCPFPDADVGAALNSAPFDAVYVQFYNNYCETSASSEFNFATWDNWAKTQSANPDVKVYLGAPGSPQAAGDGYVNAGTLASVARAGQSKYSSFGGVMLWDADSAYTNGRFDLAVKNAISNGPSSPVTSASTHKASTSPVSIPTSKTSVVVVAPTPTPMPTPTPEPSQTSTFSTEVSVSFRDPRATARVKRPSFSFGARNEAATAVDEIATRPPSRLFRF